MQVMGQPGKSPSGTAQVPSSGTTLVILGTIANTTWRMFTPVVVLLLVGMQLDKHLGHRPLWSLGGVTAGFVIAVWLVYRQYRHVSGQQSIEQQQTRDIQE